MNSVDGRLRTTLAIVGVLGAIAVVSLIQVEFVTGRLNAGVIDPEYCSPSALHTPAELPETQFTRDFAAIRILLRDPGDNFGRIRMIYEGRLRGPAVRRTDPW